MIDDDDALDLALAALPLEEPPARLHGRIMAATVYRPRVAVIGWETWLIATLAAVALWLGWLVISVPRFSDRLSDTIARLADAGGLTSLTTLGWLAVGISVVWWLSQLTIPSRRLRSR
jgi:hypothetical protein